MRVVLLVILCLGIASAAPLDRASDIPEWVGPSLATIRAKGLVRGYPQGDFKGDRCLSRWELAMILARVLEALDSGLVTLASAGDLDTIRALSQEFQAELSLLGIDRLETSLGALDHRVTELERVHFYGHLESRIVSQAFVNRGAPDNNASRGSQGPPSGVPYLDYNAVVGSGQGPPLRPYIHGVLPVTDFPSGRALSNGVGLTMLGSLGLRMRIAEEWLAQMELAAFTSQGDASLNLSWGVSAPYLLNGFTADSTAGPLAFAQPLNSVPFTRAVLDNFRLTHEPTRTRLLLGTFDRLSMDSHVYAGQPNPGVWGVRRWPGFGVLLNGDLGLAQAQSLRWEAFASRFGNSNRYLDTNYQNLVVGADVGYEFPKGHLRLDFARVMEEAPPNAPLLIGLMTNINVAYGASTGWTARQWVNPPGYFAGQQSPFEQAQSGQSNAEGAFLPSTVDTRPISGWNGNQDNAIGFTAGGGNFGPQDQTTIGLSAGYRVPIDETDGHQLRLHVDLGPVELSAKSQLTIQRLGLDGTSHPRRGPV